MQTDALAIQYISVDGPEGLQRTLNELFEATHSKTPNQSEYYIMYHLGNQKSLIKLDLGQEPFLFWYYDLLGRPATKVVKDILAEFAWEKGGEKKRYMREFAIEESK